jgi:hypothetical protein
MAIAAPRPSSVPVVPAAVLPGARRAARRQWPINIPATVLVIGGGVLQLVALVDAAWLDSPSGRVSFTGLVEWTVPGFAYVFTAWLAWLLVAVTVGAGVAACVRWRGAAVFRYTGALIGVAGAIMAVAAVLLLAYQTDDPSFHVARNYGPGLYLETLGLLAAGLGAAAGTGRRG